MQRLNKISLFLVMAIVVISLVSCNSDSSSVDDVDSTQKEDTNLLSINKKAPKFNYKNINTNDDINNEALIGKTTLISFFTVNDSSSIDEIDTLKKVSDDFDINLVFVEILSEHEDDVKNFIDENNMNDYIVIHDKYANLSGDYVVTSPPKTVFLDKNGLYKGALEHSASYDEIKDIINRIDQN